MIDKYFCAFDFASEPLKVGVYSSNLRLFDAWLWKESVKEERSGGKRVKRKLLERFSGRRSTDENRTKKSLLRPYCKSSAARNKTTAMYGGFSELPICMHVFM